MYLQQATTAERTSKAPIELIPLGTADRLDGLGQLLYGEHWLSPMARDLHVCKDTLTKWASGQHELPPDHLVFSALAVLVHYHDTGAAKARKIMDRESGLIESVDRFGR